MIEPNKRTASYCGTKAEWDALATEFFQNGESRMASTIRDGIKRQGRPDRHWWSLGNDIPGVFPSDVFCLRFRGGSIDKMDRAITRENSNA
jgi:hypothetical protein